LTGESGARAVRSDIQLLLLVAQLFGRRLHERALLARMLNGIRTTPGSGKFQAYGPLGHPDLTKRDLIVATTFDKFVFALYKCNKQLRQAVGVFGILSLCAPAWAHPVTSNPCEMTLLRFMANSETVNYLIPVALEATHGHANGPEIPYARNSGVRDGLCAAFGEAVTKRSCAAKQARHRSSPPKRKNCQNLKRTTTTFGSLTTPYATDTIAKAATARALAHLLGPANVDNQISNVQRIHACRNELTY
jgi:hypothetical protein